MAPHSTLAEANESLDWRIHAELAQRLVAQARSLYAQETLRLRIRAGISAALICIQNHAKCIISADLLIVSRLLV